MSGNVVIKMSVQRMVCTGCGSEANATCNCGVSYVPKRVQRERVAKAIEENPDRTVREISEETGVPKSTVHRVMQGRVVPFSPNGTGDHDPETGEVREDDGCDGDEDFWRRSLGNMAGDAVSLKDQWTRQFGNWERFEVTSDLVTLARQQLAERSFTFYAPYKGASRPDGRPRGNIEGNVGNVIGPKSPRVVKGALRRAVKAGLIASPIADALQGVAA